MPGSPFGEWALTKLQTGIPLVTMRATDGPQVEQSMMVRFWPRKTRSKTMMQLLQCQCPSTYFFERWSDFFFYGIVLMLHALLSSDVLTLMFLFLLTECHIF